MLQDLGNVLSHQEKTSYNIDEKITAMCATKDSKHLVVASHSIEVVSKQGSPQTNKHADLMSPIPETPDLNKSNLDGEKIKQPSSLWLIDIKNRDKEQFTLEDDDLNPNKEILALGVTSDSKYIVTGWNDGSVNVYDLPGRKRACKFKTDSERKSFVS